MASYTLISQEEVRNRDTSAAGARVEAAGFDGVVTLRLVGNDQELSYQPGMVYPNYYTGFWSYYDYAWSSVMAPAYLQVERVVSVETNVYSLTDEMLVWAGITETFKPDDMTRTVSDIADAVSGEMRRQGLIN